MAEKKMRVTSHNGRKGKDGVYSVKHNDRQFDLRNAPHIDAEKTKENWNWKIEKDAKTNDECERIFYQKHFGKMLEERNQRYIDQRHPERCQTIDQYRQNEKFCPEETIFQIGDKDTHVDPRELKKICAELLKYEVEKYPNVKYLDMDLHVDEEGAPHIHKRKVWLAHDDNGNETVSQNRALKEMGVKRPDPSKPQSRFNNPKMTYTADIRNKFIEICREHGLEIEHKPQEKSRSGLELQAFKTRQEEERAQFYIDEQKRLMEETQTLQKDILELETDKNTLTAEKRDIEVRIKELEPLSDEIFLLNEKKHRLHESIANLDEKIAAQRKELQRNTGMQEFLKTREELVVMDIEIKKGMGGKTVTNVTPEQLESLIKTSDALEDRINEVKHRKDEIMHQGYLKGRESVKPDMEKLENIAKERLVKVAELSNLNKKYEKIISHIPEPEVNRAKELIKQQGRIRTRDL